MKSTVLLVLNQELKWLSWQSTW